jgi:hypothetical protein
VDGGNLFSPYSVAEIARGYDLDYQEVLDKVYVSRAFTVHQLSSLVLEKLYSVLRKTRTRLLIVSDITSLFMDRDVPKVESRELFIRVCSKLAQTALEEQMIVAVSYFPDRRSRQGLFLEAILFGKCNVLIKLKRKSGVFTFVLEDHPRFKPFTIDFEAVHAPSAMFHGGVNLGENSSIL